MYWITLIGLIFSVFFRTHYVATAADLSVIRPELNRKGGSFSTNRLNRFDAMSPVAEPYQREALKLVLQEANQVAKELVLPETLPITEHSLVRSFILPRAGAQSWKTIGKIVTRNYAYYVSKDNKFCFLEGTHQEEDIQRWRSEYWLPVSQVDTNTAYQLATQWLAAASMDVKALNRDCRLHIDAFTP